jgi:hypothetical protein
MEGKNCTLGTVYGPNNNDADFFVRLSDAVRNLNNNLIMLAGDWNCTYSTDEIRNNIDCINMVRPPNRNHSLAMAEMCDALGLTDPYRVLNPNKKEYSYVPRVRDANNRSRIDFFLLSYGLIHNNMSCTVLPNLQNKLFDHRAVVLSYKKVIKNNGLPIRIDSKILKDDIVDLIIYAATAEAYALHADAEQVTEPVRREHLRNIGQLKILIRDLGPPITPYEEVLRDNGVDFADRREILLREGDQCKDDINLPLLQQWPLVPDPDVFFETLTGMIKNELVSYQVYRGRAEKSQLSNLRNSIDALKIRNDAGEIDDAGLVDLFRLEKSLDDIMDAVMRDEFKKNSSFEVLNAEKITPHFIKMMKVGGGVNP